MNSVNALFDRPSTGRSEKPDEDKRPSTATGGPVFPNYNSDDEGMGTKLTPSPPPAAPSSAGRKSRHSIKGIVVLQ